MLRIDPNRRDDENIQLKLEILELSELLRVITNNVHKKRR